MSSDLMIKRGQDNKESKTVVYDNLSKSIFDSPNQLKIADFCVSM